MISICIPTYNYIVTELVEELAEQCTNAKIDFEILVFEDGSLESFYKINQKNISDIPNVNHRILPENIGRSAIRNLLASNSKYEKLLFIDCDSKLPDKEYINRYLENYNHDIVCGGTMYIESQKEINKTLRYKYGIKSEMISAKERNKNPNASFATNNFLISKKIFDTIKFREFLKKYGHEDSLFGYELKTNSYKIFHIDNPVIHIGIEDNFTFLKKTEDGINNLILIEKNNDIDVNFKNEIKLVRTYNKLKKYRINNLLGLLYNLFNKSTVKYLIKSENPSIFIFNIYKLAYFHKEYKKAEKYE